LKSNSGGAGVKNFQDSVREYYDSFQPRNTLASKLTFYSDLKKQFSGIKIPDSTAKLTFGCLNPVSHLIEDFKSKKRDFSESINIIDAGGGAGFDSFLLRQIFPNASIYNVDLSRNLLKLGREEFKKHLGCAVNESGGVFFICATLADLGIIKNRKFDYIISNAALNLVADKSRVLAAAADLLADDGSFFLADIACGGDSAAPRVLAERPISDGVYYAPTIVSEKEYDRLILDVFGYRDVLEKKVVKPEMIGGEELSFSVFCSHIRKRPPAEKESIPCACGNKIELDVFLSVNAENSKLYVPMILERRLNSAFCLKCRKAYYDFIPYYFEWPAKNIAAHVFPSSLRAQSSMVMARLGMIDGAPENSLFFGYEEFRKFLAEKAEK
jgi:SAM-dependent methyltransferase